MQKTRQGLTIQFKIQDQSYKIVLDIDDDKDSLFNKLVVMYPACQDRKAQILDKFRNDLEKMAKGDHVKMCLQGTVRKYIGAVFQGKRSQSQERKRSLERSRSKKRLEMSMRQERLRSKENVSAVASPGQHARSFCSGRKSGEKGKRSEVNSQKEKDKKSRKVSQRDGRSNSSFNRDSPNEDVVKACQVIMQKTSQGDIKAMAKKYLQQIGRLPAEQKKKNLKVFEESRNNNEQEETANVQQIQQARQSEQIEQKQQPIPSGIPEAPPRTRSSHYRSPIQGLNNTVAHLRSNPNQSVSVNGFKYNYDNPQLRINNRYNYLQQLQPTLTPIDYTTYQSSQPLRNSSFHQKRYQYLQNLLP